MVGPHRFVVCIFALFKGIAADWATQTGSAGADIAVGIAVDSAGHVHLAGVTEGRLGGSHQGQQDVFWQVLGSDGGVMSTVQFGTSSFDQGRDIAVDASGNAYIVGNTGGSLAGGSLGGSDLFLHKYNSAKSLVIGKQFGTINDDYVSSMALDSSNLYLTGTTSGVLEGSAVGDFDAFVIKVRVSDLGIVWSKQFGSVLHDEPWAIAVVGTGAVACGSTKGAFPSKTHAGNEDVFCTRLNALGSIEWSFQTGTSQNERARGVAVDGQSNIYVTGSTKGHLEGQTHPDPGRDLAFLMKLGSAGVIQWTRLLESSALTSIGHSVVVATNIWMAGTTDGVISPESFRGATDVFIVGYDPSGNLIWKKQIGPSGSSHAHSYWSGSRVLLVNAAETEIHLAASTYGTWSSSNAGLSDLVVLQLSMEATTTPVITTATTTTPVTTTTTTTATTFVTTDGLTTSTHDYEPSTTTTMTETTTSTRCASEYFGDSCQERRVQFHSNSGFCLEEHSNAAICKGIVIAAAQEDEWCTAEQDCEAWSEIKYMVALMFEAEVSDMIVDFMAVCFCLAAVVMKFCGRGDLGKSLLLVTLISFVADIALEALLVHSILGASEAISTVKEAFCLSQGDGYAMLVLLDDLANTIQALAWLNIVIAVVGGASEVVQTCQEACKKSVESMAFLVTTLAAVAELAISVSTFALNTLEFIEVINAIEEATLGLTPLENSHVCFKRHPNLPLVEAAGVAWGNPLMIMVIPGSVVLACFLCAVVWSCRSKVDDDPDDRF
ncbi:BIG2 domain-containing protein [Durusdinium trenchii]|uniref:BIG2 domain-containing protein n=1 Tax=Durusdinium trenchii TaxID=1381693 RepID=A0ABP0M5J9_9DINO